MEKKSIFKKIDDFCTKATIAIIGDIPHDGEHQETESSQPTQKVGITHTLTYAKEKFLRLGTPSDEKALLYEEVVKKEAQISIEEVISFTQENTVTKEETPIETEASPSVDTEEKSLETQTEISAEKESPSRPEQPSENIEDSNPQEEKVTNSESTANVENAPKELKVPKTATKQIKKTTTKKSSDTKKSTSKVTKKSDITPKKQESSKKVTKSKAKKEKKGSKRAEKIELYAKHIKKYYGSVDKDFLTIVVKNLGPSIYNADAELVSCSEPKELEYVRKQFLKKKLGIDASKKVLDAAIQDVCQELKSSRKKYRATFYYALAKKFKKESVLS